jgi:hypothetical protein
LNRTWFHPGLASIFNDSTGIAIDSERNEIVAERDNLAVRRATKDGYTTTITGQSRFRDFFKVNYIFFFFKISLLFQKALTGQFFPLSSRAPGSLRSSMIRFTMGAFLA